MRSTTPRLEGPCLDTDTSTLTRADGRRRHDLVDEGLEWPDESEDLVLMESLWWDLFFYRHRR